MHRPNKCVVENIEKWAQIIWRLYQFVFVHIVLHILSFVCFADKDGEIREYLEHLVARLISENLDDVPLTPLSDVEQCKLSRIVSHGDTQREEEARNWISELCLFFSPLLVLFFVFYFFSPFLFQIRKYSRNTIRKYLPSWRPYPSHYIRAKIVST